jgi:hypothetical protein
MGGFMRESRRGFVLAFSAAASCLAADTALFAQRRGFPSPPEPAEKQNPASAAASAAHQPSPRKVSQKDEQEFCAGVERLYQLSAELRDEVRKTLTSEVLSLRMYRKTEEIEKLAKQLNSKAKGQGN